MEWPRRRWLVFSVLGWSPDHSDQMSQVSLGSLFESTAMALPRLVGGEVMGGKVEPSIPPINYTHVQAIPQKCFMQHLVSVQYSLKPEFHQIYVLIFYQWCFSQDLWILCPQSVFVPRNLCPHVLHNNSLGGDALGHSITITITVLQSYKHGAKPNHWHRVSKGWKWNFLAFCQPWPHFFGHLCLCHD